eukprot:272762-Prymnesium_polylepis.1
MLSSVVLSTKMANLTQPADRVGDLRATDDPGIDCSSARALQDCCWSLRRYRSPKQSLGRVSQDSEFTLSVPRLPRPESGSRASPDVLNVWILTRLSTRLPTFAPCSGSGVAEAVALR